MRKKSPSVGWENRSKLIKCSVYRRTETDLVSIFLRRPRPVVCCRRSKPVTNKLPGLAGGVHCFIEESLTWTFSPQPASWRGSSHSTSLSKPNWCCWVDTCTVKKQQQQQQKKKKKKKKKLDPPTTFARDKYYKSPKLISSSYAITTFFTSTY